MRWLQSQLLFKFFSSAKLAVPVLLLIAAVTSWGTILESRYNADYAKLIVYDSWWFRGLLFVLGMTIFLSTLSRWPWKKRHVGFLITHLGLLVLLAGSVITMNWGIDGQLQVFEGESGSQVAIKERVFEYAGPREFKKIYIPPSASAKSESRFSRQNDHMEGFFKILEYRPFVKENTAANIPTFQSGRFLGFRIQSAFFDQEEWLHSEEKQSILMGPAQIRMISSSESKTVAASAKTKKKSPPKSGQDQLVIVDMKTGQELKRVNISEGKSGFVVGDVKVKIKKLFQYATVSENKITEGQPGSPNPALEVEFSKGNENQRDVLFAKFPDFSLIKENKIGLRGVYKVESVNADQSEATDSPAAAVIDNNARNVIEFIYSPENEDKVTIHLMKDGKTVLRQPAKLNEAIETPWMGMKITLTKLKATDSQSTATDEIQEVELKPKQNFLPPSAIRVMPIDMDAKPFWLTEGQVKEVGVRGETYQVYYGSDSIRLPFAVKLIKFHKVDYPGTETAMTFASDVQVSGETAPITISMNEPLKKDGYTLYQSSYDLQPGRPALSIFSVNRDPGRWVKYLGSIILAIGIITYTIMRSRLAKKEVTS